MAAGVQVNIQSLVDNLTIAIHVQDKLRNPLVAIFKLQVTSRLPAARMTTSQSLFLDPALRDWVLLPIFVVMIMVGILRHYATLLLQSTPKPEPLKSIREQYSPSRPPNRALCALYTLYAHS